MESGARSTDRALAVRTLRGGALAFGALVAVTGAASCGGRSTSEEGSHHENGGAPGATGGDAGATSGSSALGGVSAGGVSAGGAPAGGASVGGGPITTTVCSAPVVPGSCRGYEPSYWFDPSTGLCMPFVYSGCEGNANRFPTVEDCYATCGGRGEHDNAACSESYECRTVRLAEPCCTTDVRQFVSVRNGVGFACSDPTFGCTSCAADCVTTSDDGYIGSRCSDGHCVPFDARSSGFASCSESGPNGGCYLRMGVDCCPSCSSQLVALGGSEQGLQLLACGPNVACDTSGCEPPSEVTAQCVSGVCTVVGPRIGGR